MTPAATTTAVSDEKSTNLALDRRTNRETPSASDNMMLTNDAAGGGRSVGMFGGMRGVTKRRCFFCRRTYFLCFFSLPHRFALFERATDSYVNPKFDSAVLEKQVRQSSFDEARLRFRIALLFSMVSLFSHRHLYIERLTPFFLYLSLSLTLLCVL